MAMSHNWCYDLADDHHFSQACPERKRRNPESLLVWLCDECATGLEAEGEVCFASTDALCDIRCRHCGAPVTNTERTRR